MAAIENATEVGQGRSRYERLIAGASRDVAGEVEFSSDGFRNLALGFQHARVERQRAEAHAAAQEHSRRMQELVDHQVGNNNWQTLLHGTRAAAARVLDCPSIMAGDIRLFLAWGQ